MTINVNLKDRRAITKSTIGTIWLKQYVWLDYVDGKLVAKNLPGDIIYARWEYISLDQVELQED